MPPEVEDPVHAPAAAKRRFSFRAYHVAALIFVVAVAGLLIYAFYPTLTGASEEDERPEVDAAERAPVRVGTMTLAPQDFILRAEATGYLAPWRTAEVSSEASGRVVNRNVEEGQFVGQGALLLRLDDRELEIEVQEAQAELLNARAVYAVNTSRSGERAAADTSGLAAARATLAEADAAFERGELSQEQLAEARRRFEAQLVLSGRERSAVQAVTAGLSQAENRLARAQLMLNRTRVEAPFAGRIADLDVEVGQHVPAGQRILSLIDDTRMKVEVDVLESDLVRVRQGATATVRVPSMGDATFRGTVYSVNPRVESGTGTGRVAVAVSNPQGSLLSGLFAYVELETGRLEDRIVVPAEAVLVRQGRDLVFRIEDGRAKWVYVTVGRRSGDEVEILDGLDAGDEIAVSGHFALAHDAPVVADAG